MSTERDRSSGARARSYRQRMRALGMRPIQIWVPDVNAPEFAAEARRQSRLIAESPYEEEDEGFVDALTADLDPE